MIPIAEEPGKFLHVFPDGSVVRVVCHNWGLEIQPLSEAQVKTYKLSPSGNVYVEVWREQQLQLPLEGA